MTITGHDWIVRQDHVLGGWGIFDSNSRDRGDNVWHARQLSYNQACQILEILLAKPHLQPVGIAARTNTLTTTDQPSGGDFENWTTEQIRTELDDVQRQLENKHRNELSQLAVAKLSLRRTRLEQVLTERAGTKPTSESISAAASSFTSYRETFAPELNALVTDLIALAEQWVRDAARFETQAETYGSEGYTETPARLAWEARRLMACASEVRDLINRLA